MAAAIKALNAKIRSNPYTDYLCSTRESPFENEMLPLRRAWTDMRSTVAHHSNRILTRMPLYRLLGSRIQLWYPSRCRHGHTKGPRNV